MPKIVSVPWREIKTKYIEKNIRLIDLAEEYAVSLSVVEQRSSKEGWVDAKKAFWANTNKEEKVEIVSQITPIQQPKTPKVYVSKIDSLSCLEDAIEQLHSELPNAKVRSLEGAVTALAKLLELRSKLVPHSAGDIADMCIDLNISPTDFIQTLASKWQVKENEKNSQG